jgi:hypothetical protein
MADRLTDEQVAALTAAEAKAMPPPWESEHVYGFELGAEEDAEFCVVARNAMPALLAELATLRAENQRLYKLACDAAPTMVQAEHDAGTTVWSVRFWAEVNWRNGMGPEPK